MKTFKLRDADLARAVTDSRPIEEAVADEPRRRELTEALLRVLFQFEFAVSDEPLQRMIAGSADERRVDVEGYRALAVVYARAAAKVGDDGLRAGYLARSHAAYACVALLIGATELIARHVQAANDCYRTQCKWASRGSADAQRTA
jgi:hypothetical protein